MRRGVPRRRSPGAQQQQWCQRLTKFFNRYMTPDWTWNELYAPFARLGDTFMTVAPGGVLIWTASAAAISQITSKRDAFPKPLESYKILNIFGRNVVTVEGSTWRQHRKVTAPHFNERNNMMVFRESISQTQQMVGKWTGGEEDGGRRVDDLPEDTMRLTLHVISRAGFGVKLEWPSEDEGEKRQGVEKISAEGGISSAAVPEGHTMSFKESLSTLLEKVVLVLLVPKWLLSMMHSSLHLAKRQIT